MDAERFLRLIDQSGKRALDLVVQSADGTADAVPQTTDELRAGVFEQRASSGEHALDGAHDARHQAADRSGRVERID
mgnify:CR=1 FL=1